MAITKTIELNLRNEYVGDDSTKDAAQFFLLGTVEELQEFVNKFCAEMYDEPEGADILEFFMKKVESGEFPKDKILPFAGLGFIAMYREYAQKRMALQGLEGFLKMLAEAQGEDSSDDDDDPDPDSDPTVNPPEGDGQC